MSLLDDVKKNNGGPGAKCRMGIALADMPDDLRAETVEVLALSPDQAQHRAIAHALKTRGFTVSNHTISRHRRKECACDPA